MPDGFVVATEAYGGFMCTISWGKAIAQTPRKQQGIGASIRTPFKGTLRGSAATPELIF